MRTAISTRSACRRSRPRRREGLVDAVDGFCEGIAFSPAQIGRVFDRAAALGLPVKLHAEQLSNLGGAALAASYGALSADHLEYLDAAGVAAMAAAGTVAVLLPGAFYTLRETQAPPVAALRAAGVPMAVATDCNPGSSPLTSILLGDEHGLHAVPPDAGGGAGRRHADRGAGAGAGRLRHDCAGDAGRSRGLGRGAPRRARLSHGLEPAGAADLRGRGMMADPRHNLRDVYPPTGPEISAKSWLTEAPLRMLMNNLHPDVAENPHELVVYGGIGRAARTWADFDRIVASLKTLEADETLLVQSGKPVGVFRTHADAPRVLIANSNLVPHWATWDKFNELDRAGLMMYGQMTAGSWIYIGTQGIVQGTFETFAEAGRQHYGGDLRGRWILTGGLGGMGGAQPLAAVFAGACCLAVECDETRIDFRIRTRYLDAKATSLDEALEMIRRWTAAGEAKSVGLLGNAAEVFPELVRHDVRPDIVTDQTSAHDPINGYLPVGWTVGEWREKRESDPKAVERAARSSMKTAGRRDGRVVAHGRAGARLRQQHPPDGAGRGAEGGVRLPGLRARLHPAAVLPRDRAVPLVRAVGRSGGHIPHRRQGARADARRRAPAPMARHGARADRLPGAAGADLLGRARGPAPARAGVQRDGGVGRAEGADRDRARPSGLGVGGEPEPRDRGDEGRLRRGLGLAAAERAAELRQRARPGSACTTAAAWAWASRQHSGMVVVADGTPEAARRLERVLWNDPATGVMRHADAGYADRARLRPGEGAAVAGDPGGLI